MKKKVLLCAGGIVLAGFLAVLVLRPKESKRPIDRVKEACEVLENEPAVHLTMEKRENSYGGPKTTRYETWIFGQDSYETKSSEAGGWEWLINYGVGSYVKDLSAEDSAWTMGQVEQPGAFWRQISWNRIEDAIPTTAQDPDGVWIEFLDSYLNGGGNFVTHYVTRSFLLNEKNELTAYRLQTKEGTKESATWTYRIHCCDEEKVSAKIEEQYQLAAQQND